MRQVFDRVSLWFVDHRFVTLTFVLVVSALAATGYVDPDLFRRHWIAQQAQENPNAAPSSGGGWRRSNRNLNSAGSSEAVSVTRGDSILVIESDQFFTIQGAAALRAIVETLEDLDYVDEVMWMDRVPPLNVFGLPEPILPRSEATPQRFEVSRAKALAHPLVRGQLLSQDGRTLLMLVRLNWLFVGSDEDCVEHLRDVASQTAAKFADVKMSFGVTGMVPLRLAAMKEHEQNQTRYQVIGYSMTVIMALVLFRGWIAVFIVAMAPSLGVFWTLGLLRFADMHDNPFNDVVLPVMLSLVGLTDGVHLMVQIRRFRVAGLDERQATREGVREVGLACALTSLTTAIGFGSLSLAHHETVREFGQCCVVGVILTFIAVMTAIPLLCSTVLGRRVQAGHDKGFIERHLSRISVIIDVVLKHRVVYAVMGVVSTIVLCLVSLQLRPDERNANALPENCEPVRVMEQLDLALGGLEQGSVDVKWSDDVAPDSPEILDVVTQVSAVLQAEPLIGNPLSIESILAALQGEGPLAERMSMLDLLAPPLKRAYYTPNENSAVVGFRVQDLGIARYGPVFERIQAGLRKIAVEHPEFHLEMGGSAVWRWENLYQIVVDLAASLGSAFVVILAVLAIAYRSIRIGLIALVPNLFPLAITGAYLVWTGQSLEIVSVCAFTICLGIAVDDTIHFLTRFQEEQLRTDDQLEAIRKAFVGVGSALIMTTVILIAGFSTVLMSGLRDHRIFAAMGALTISAALFGDLVFLPAMLACFAKKKSAQQLSK